MYQITTQQTHHAKHVEISSLRPCAFWGYEVIYSCVLGANNAYFNEMCYCNEEVLKILRLDEYIL